MRRAARLPDLRGPLPAPAGLNQPLFIVAHVTSVVFLSTTAEARRDPGDDPSILLRDALRGAGHGEQLAAPRVLAAAGQAALDGGFQLDQVGDATVDGHELVGGHTGPVRERRAAIDVPGTEPEGSRCATAGSSTTSARPTPMRAGASSCSSTAWTLRSWASTARHCGVWSWTRRGTIRGSPKTSGHE